MNTQHDTSLKNKKITFFQKIIHFASNDDNYIETSSIEIHPTVQISQKKSSSYHTSNIKAFILVILFFYILLCAFILVNPQFSLFFNNIFGIQYITIKFILQYTIYIFYSIFGIGIGIAFLFFWYRTLTIKTRKKYKQTILGILTVISGGLFFGNIAFFAVTYSWFQNIDFSNIQERVLLYDNNLLGYKEKYFSEKALTFFQVPKLAIGPLNVRYDISPQIKKIVREKGILLNQGYSFEIDYNGDESPDIGSGENVDIDLPISNSKSPVLVPGKFEKPWQYKAQATLRGVDSGGNKVEASIDIPVIMIQNVVGITQWEKPDGTRTYIFDATSLSNMGQARWSILNNTGSEYAWYQYSPKDVTKFPAVVCLKIQSIESSAEDLCDWRYVINDSIQTNISDTAIKIQVDPLDPLKYQFSVDPTLVQWEIQSIRWQVDGKLYEGKFSSWTEKIFDYTFPISGTYKVEAQINDTLGNTVTISTKPIFTTLFTELKTGFMLRILDEESIDIAKNKYTPASKTYFLADIPAPTVLTFDAKGIQSINPRLKLAKVEWDMDNDGVYEITNWKITYEVSFPEQYTFYARYTFEDKTIIWDVKTQIFIDKIVVKGIEKPIDIRIKIKLDHEYAPALAHFDVTWSRIIEGEIIKFIYDFWDGSKLYEGEGIVDYRYKIPGEYKVKITVVTKDGRRATKELILIVKKPQERLTISPSVSPENAQPGFPITFQAGVQWATQSILWNFWDNSGVREGETVIHTFNTSGAYTITAHATYESGIEKIETIIYHIK